MKKQIPDFPNYFIYSDGRVFSTASNKFLKRGYFRNGTYRINLKNKNKSRDVSPSRLVAEAFIKKEHPDYDTVFHIDGNTRNSHYKNLKWSDFQSVMRQKAELNKYPIPFKDDRGRISYPTSIIIYDLIKNKWSYPAIREIFPSFDLSDLLALRNGPDVYYNSFII